MPASIAPIVHRAQPTSPSSLRAAHAGPSGADQQRDEEGDAHDPALAQHGDRAVVGDHHAHALLLQGRQRLLEAVLEAAEPHARHGVVAPDLQAALHQVEAPLADPLQAVAAGDRVADVAAGGDRRAAEHDQQRRPVADGRLQRRRPPERRAARAPTSSIRLLEREKVTTSPAAMIADRRRQRRQLPGRRRTQASARHGQDPHRQVAAEDVGVEEDPVDPEEAAVDVRLLQGLVPPDVARWRTGRARRSAAITPPAMVVTASAASARARGHHASTSR